jgi:hypothetical protein
LAAEQAGWQTADGVHVGMSQGRLAKLYPFVDELRPSSTAKLFVTAIATLVIALIALLAS